MGLEVSAGVDVSLGQVSEKVDHMGSRIGRKLDKLAENRFIPKTARYILTVPATLPGPVNTVAAMRLAEECPVGRAWNIMSVSVAPIQGVTNAEFADGLETAAPAVNFYIGGGAASSAGGSGGVTLDNTGQSYGFAALPHGQGIDFVGSVVAPTLATGVLTFSRYAQWARMNEQPYIMLFLAAGIPASNYLFRMDYHDYDEDDILPGVIGGAGGVRKSRPVPMLNEA